MRQATVMYRIETPDIVEILTVWDDRPLHDAHVQLSYVYERARHYSSEPPGEDYIEILDIELMPHSMALLPEEERALMDMAERLFWRDRPWEWES